MLAKGAANTTLCLGKENVKLANGDALGMQAPIGTWALLSLNDMVQLRYMQLLLTNSTNVKDPLLLAHVT